MTTPLRVLDRFTPPTDAELAALRAATGNEGWMVYGGLGSEWSAPDYARVKTAGYGTVMMWVPPQGDWRNQDGGAMARTARHDATVAGCAWVCLDCEEGPVDADRDGWVSWCEQVAAADGTVGVYSGVGPLDYLLGFQGVRPIPSWCWLALWNQPATALPDPGSTILGPWCKAWQHTGSYPVVGTVVDVSSALLPLFEPTPLPPIPGGDMDNLVLVHDTASLVWWLWNTAQETWSNLTGNLPAVQAWEALGIKVAEWPGADSFAHGLGAH